MKKEGDDPHGKKDDNKTASSERKKEKKSKTPETEKKDSNHINEKRDDDKRDTLKSPRIDGSSRIKARFKGEEVHRLARNAANVLVRILLSLLVLQATI